MAAAAPLQSLKHEASCPICLDFYRDPVTTRCGHNFCRPCLAEYWGATGGTQGPCPDCRHLCSQQDLTSNRKLLNMVELLKALPEGPERPPEGSVCEKHQERLKIYCRKEEKAICTVCSLSAEHRGHHMAPLEEAALEHKESLQTQLKALKNQLEEVQAWTREQTLKASELEGQFKREEDRIVEDYRKFKQFLEENKQQTLTVLNATKETNLGKIQGKVSELKRQQLSLRGLIEEMEEKCQQEDLELLKDAKSLLSRSGSVKILKPENNLDALQKCVQSYASHYAFLQEQIKTFKGSFPAELRKLERKCIQSFEVRVTLDPDTAHPRLALSEDGRLLEHRVRKQNWPDNPKRFTVSRCVLGKEGFTSGQHYWEVQLLQDDGWAVGVALESVGRKEPVTQSPNGGIWALKKQKGMDSTPSNLSPREHPMTLGVYLDYEGGLLSVYNAETCQCLYICNAAAFPGRVFPYFCVWERLYIEMVSKQKILFGYGRKEAILRLL